jgi:hypothetical protein
MGMSMAMDIFDDMDEMVDREFGVHKRTKKGKEKKVSIVVMYLVYVRQRKTNTFAVG